MADHSKPTIDSNYSSFVDEIDVRFDDLAVGLDPAVTSPTNIPTNSIRWNSVNNKWEKYDGSSWNNLSTSYDIGVNKLITTNWIVEETAGVLQIKTSLGVLKFSMDSSGFTVY